MLTCENCGVNFEEADSLVEVTSLRVLCPKCAAERAAAKARRAAPSLAGTPKPSAPAKPAAPPVPAARPVQRAAPAPAPTPKPAPRAEAKPAPSATRDAKPAPSAPAARDAKPASPAARDARPAAGASSRPSSLKTPPRKPAKKKIDIDSLASHGLQKKRGTREILVATLSALLVLAVAGVVLWKVVNKKQGENAVQQAYRARIDKFHKDFDAMSMATEAEATLLISFADENNATWKEQDFAPDVMSRVAKAKTYLQDQDRHRKLTQRLDELEAVMAKAAELPPSELAEVRRSLDELAASADTVGSDFVARVTKDRADCEAVYLERLDAAAVAAAAAEPLDRAALTTLQQSEDEVFKMFNATALAWQKNNQDAALTAKKNDLQTRYQKLVTLSDEAVVRFFTPDVIESTPWRDLLADDQASAWKGGADIKGFERRLENGTMHLIGPDPAEKSDAMISIGDKEVWRDLVIDTEFTIEKGNFTFWFRCPLVWNEKVYSLEMVTDGDGSIEAGRSYSYSLRLVASDFTYQNKSEDSQEPQTSSISWTIPRKGALAIGVPKGTEVKFTRLRVKVLR